MINFFYSIDLSVFYFINQSIANPIFDNFFIFITDVKNWYLLYIVLWFICFFKGGRIGKIAAILSLFLIAVSDQVSSFVIKNLVERIRPCNALPDVRILTGCTSSFSFPSSHAVNNFAAAVFFYKIFPNLKWILFIIAFLIAFSRIYVGKHYPSDVIGGAIIGSAIGYIFGFIALWINQLLKLKV
jgi:undecaprenyl-diphosphatase